MIQDIAPYTLYNEYRDFRPQKDSIILFFAGQGVLANLDGGNIVYPSYGELTSEPKVCVYLFAVDERTFFLALDRPVAGLEKYTFETLQTLRTCEPRHLVFAGLIAHQLYRWYRDNLYCGRCGSTFIHSKIERMLKCNECGNVLYPKISPAVIIGVTDEENILLIKHSGGYKNYALIAGFAEVGETIEQTVAREVKEEVGLNVKNIRFYKSQPWPLSESLLFGFYAELDGEVSAVPDGKEVSEASWFQRTEIPVEANDFSLTNEMIIHFKDGGYM